MLTHSNCAASRASFDPSHSAVYKILSREIVRRLGTHTPYRTTWLFSALKTSCLLHQRTDGFFTPADYAGSFSFLHCDQYDAHVADASGSFPMGMQSSTKGVDAPCANFGYFIVFPETTITCFGGKVLNTARFGCGSRLPARRRAPQHSETIRKNIRDNDYIYIASRSFYSVARPGNW